MAISPGGRPADASPLGKGTGPRELDDYIREVAHALIREHGMPLGHAIAVARNMMRKWAAGGGGVRPQVQAAAAAAIVHQKLLDADGSRKGRKRAD